uniref:Coiled-coil domain containing 136b n=1 Tax=Pygocentrus nattereri TaxID=42514 RepID=A0AAR2L3F2_PYGNA
MTHSEILSTTQSELTVLTMWFLTLYGLLEDERLASAHQAEAFTHQIQHLQGTQLRSVQDELDRVQELKDSELLEAQAELSLVREEVQTLREAAEECAAERENDIATLQEELCRVRAEMSRVETNAQEYELEAVTLRAEIAMKSQRREQERREGEREGGGSKSVIRMCCHVYLLIMSFLMCQCDGVRIEMRELQELFETSQKERAELELELLRCREELDKLTEGNGTQFSTEPPVLSLPFIGLIVIVAVLWCCWSELGS